MKIFVISLKRSIERRSKVGKQLKELDLDFEYFDAVDGSVEGFIYQNRASSKKTKLRNGYTLTCNEIACFASHLSMWEKCIQLNESIIVLEDNCDIGELFSSNVKSFKSLIDKYKFIKLFSFFGQKTKKIETINGSLSIVQNNKRGSGAQGYIISPETAKKFIDNAVEFIEPVDDYMEKPWRHDVKTYYFNPNVVRRAKITSTIGSDRKNKKGLTVKDKFIIEVFRLYEQIRYKLYW